MERSADAELLLTDRLRLRPVRLDDAERIYHGYARDPDVTRHLLWTPHDSLAETREFLTSCVAARERGERYAWAITRASDGRVLGMIDLRPGSPDEALGFVLARTWWGRGYMTEALRAVLRFAAEETAMERVGACCHVDNEASARVMEKAGMERVRVVEACRVFPNLGVEPQDTVWYRWPPGG